MTSEPIIRLFPWLAAIAPLGGAILVYLLLPRLWALMGRGWVQAAVILAAVIVILLETRP